MSKRRGRKREQHRQRHPSGEVRRERLGPTPEQQARREWAAGWDKKGKVRDTTKTGYPLGILLVNDAITEDMHIAGGRYAWLHQAVFGRTSIAAANYEGTPRGRDLRADDGRQAEHEAELRDADAMLRDIKAKEAVFQLCVAGHIPDWMRPIPPKHADVMQANLVIAGLARLTRCVKMAW